MPLSATSARMVWPSGSQPGLRVHQGASGRSACCCQIAVEIRAEAARRGCAIDSNDPEAGHRRSAFAFLMAQIRDPPSIGGPRWRSRTAPTARQFAAGAVSQSQGPDVRAEGHIFVRLAVGEEGQGAAIGRPGGRAVVAVASGHLSGTSERASLRVRQIGDEEVPPLPAQVAEAIKFLLSVVITCTRSARAFARSSFDFVRSSGSSSSPPVCDVKARERPSGDQTGSLAPCLSAVTCRASPPARSSTQSCGLTFSPSSSCSGRTRGSRSEQKPAYRHRATSVGCYPSPCQR